MLGDDLLLAEIQDPERPLTSRILACLAYWRRDPWCMDELVGFTHQKWFRVFHALKTLYQLGYITSSTGKWRIDQVICDKAHFKISAEGLESLRERSEAEKEQRIEVIDRPEVKAVLCLGLVVMMIGIGISNLWVVLIGLGVCVLVGFVALAILFHRPAQTADQRDQE